MARARCPNQGDQFVVRAVQPFHGTSEVSPEKVIQGVGRGYTLIRNAEKWSAAQAGAGSDKCRFARGQQWRLAMAYAGLEILAKSLQGNFATQGGPSVSNLLSFLRDHGIEEIPLPVGKAPPKGKSSEELLDFLRTHKQDRAVMEQWLGTHSSGQKTSMCSRKDALQLARVIRNLTAHGILSASLADRLNVTALCHHLTLSIADTMRHTLLYSFQQSLIGKPPKVKVNP